MSSPKKLNDEFISRGVRFPLIQNELSNLLGKILTVIDSAYSNPIQNKAIKDLIRNNFGSTVHSTFWWYCFASEMSPITDTWLKKNIIEGTLKHSESEQEGFPPPKEGFSFPESKRVIIKNRPTFPEYQSGIVLSERKR